jgi:hypothetical protein
VHEDFARSEEIAESFNNSVAKLRRNNVLIHASETQCYRARKGNNSKLKAFGLSGKLF